MGQRLRTARLRRKLSQAELGQRLAVNRQTVERLELGDPGVRLNTLCSALRALDLQLDLLGNIDDPGKDRVGLSAELSRLRGKPERKEADARDEYDFCKRADGSLLRLFGSWRHAPPSGPTGTRGSGDRQVPVRPELPGIWRELVEFRLTIPDKQDDRRNLWTGMTLSTSRRRRTSPLAGEDAPRRANHSIAVAQSTAAKKISPESENARP